MDQLCFSASESFIGVVTSAVTLASLVSNSLPAPNDAQSPTLKVISRIVHYLALDIVTAKQPATK